MSNKQPCIRDLFDLAKKNPTINMVLHEWMEGNYTLETGLIYLVKVLSAQNESLLQDLIKENLSNPNIFIPYVHSITNNYWNDHLAVCGENITPNDSSGRISYSLSYITCPKCKDILKKQGSIL